ncbi:MAG: hypothetical protein J7605_13920 [Variovorax sp.]|nr:hypothetical protein [Variovorax sp.]
MIDPNEMRTPFVLSLPLMTVSAGLSTASAVVALLVRIERCLWVDGADLPGGFTRRLLLCAAHMGSGWLAGTLAFLLSESGAFDVWAGLAFVVVASFSGARFVEAVAGWMFAARTGAASKE